MRAYPPEHVASFHGTKRIVIERLVLAVASIVVLLCVTASARAEQAAPSWSRGVLVFVDGVGAERARSELTRAIPGAIPIARGARIKKPRGDRLATVLDKAAKRKAWLRELGRTIDEAGADGAVIVYLGPARPRGHEERLLIVRGAQADVLLEQSLRLRPEAADVRVKRWRGVIEETTGVTGDKPEPEAGVVEETPTEPKAEPKPSKEPAPQQAEPQPAKAAPARARRQRERKPYAPPWLALRGGFEWGARFFRHDEPTTLSERSYTARGVGSAVGRLSLYPFTASEERGWQSFSIDIDGATSVELTSKLASPPEGTSPKVPTHFYRYGLGFHTRVPLSGADDTFGLGLGIGYMRWVFDFDAPTSTGRVAAEDYHVLKPSVGLEVRTGKLTLAFNVAYQHLLSVDDLGQRKVEGWQGGLEAEATGILRVSRSLHFGAGAAYDRFFYGLEPIPARAAEDKPGKVKDDYVRLSLFTQITF